MTDQTGDIAKAFCALNGEFSLVPRRDKDNTNYQDVKRADGAQLTFYRDCYRKKITCHGSYPDNTEGQRMSAQEWGVIGYGDTSPSAKVSENRDPEAIARDFTSRVMKKYLPLYEKALVLLKERQKWNAERLQQTNDILQVCGVEHNGSGANTEGSVNWPIKVDYRVWGENHVALELKDLTDDQAKRILAIVMETALKEKQWYHTGQYHRGTDGPAAIVDGI